MRCAHCDREVTGADQFCPGCGRPLSAEAGPGPAPGEPGTGLPASPPAPVRERSRLGLEAMIPLLTGGATVIATGAGLRAQMPGLGTALLVIGALVMLAPATLLARDWIGGRAGRLPAPGALLPATGKPLLAAVVGSLLAGSLLGVLLVGVVWPRRQTQPPADAPPAEAATACATTSSAEQILQGFKERGLPIGESEVFTAESDPEALLGRPDLYASKATFRDERLPPLGPRRAPGTPDGGTIEVFPSAEAAAARAAVDPLPRVANALPEQTVRQGPVLLRLSGRLTSEQAADYEAALAAIVPCSSLAVSTAAG